jgi:hypothetical protein
MNYQKEPLYRKVNTLARQSHHNSGGDYKHERNTKESKEDFSQEKTRKGMGQKIKRGLDYTPLYRFLISKVGQDWTEVHKEAISRLDKEEPIFYLVAKNEEEKTESICLGQTSFYSGLYVDDSNKLQKVNPQFGAEHITATCPCCTFTFNGKVIPHKYQEPKIPKLKF